MEIIEAGFVVVVVATVTKRIKIGKGRAGSLLIDDAGSGRIGNPNQLAPRVVGVGGRDRCAGGVILVTEEFYSRLAGIASLLVGQSRRVAALDGTARL